MRTVWRKENASRSNAIWFVGVEADRVSVLAPPGVSVCRRVEIEPFRRCPAGWRWGVWNRECEGHWPVIDSEPPIAVREVSTREVLKLLGDDLEELVWNCLWNQLQVARRIGHQRWGTVPSEDLARAGALSVAWLTAELTSAFPERTELLETWRPRAAMDQEMEAPENPAELIRPLCVGRDDLHTTRSSLLAASSVAWLASKLLAHHDDGWALERHRDWKAGDELDASCLPLRASDPGDLSGYGWGEDHGAEPDQTTEELTLL